MLHQEFFIGIHGWCQHYHYLLVLIYMDNTDTIVCVMSTRHTYTSLGFVVWHSLNQEPPPPIYFLCQRLRTYVHFDGPSTSLLSSIGETVDVYPMDSGPMEKYEYWCWPGKKQSRPCPPSVHTSSSGWYGSCCPVPASVLLLHFQTISCSDFCRSSSSSGTLSTSPHQWSCHSTPSQPTSISWGR